MTAAYATERRLRHNHRGPLDYDDSLVGIRHLARPSAPADPRALASALFGATLMSATLSLFPLLGRTPPPWRWSADGMATAIATHIAYVVAVASVDDAIGRTGR